MLGMIWAQGHDRAIGRGGGMAWNVPEDFAFFKRMTLGHTVIMGRRTWESLGKRYQPLPNRRNIVVTHNPHMAAPGAEIAHGLEEALSLAESSTPGNREATDSPLVWIMGGAQIYAAALPLASVLCVTDLDLEVPDADAHAPNFAFPVGGDAWQLKESSPARGWHTSVSGVAYRFSLYARRGVQIPNALALALGD